MKTTTIESIVNLYYPETGLAYAQIINTIAYSDTSSDLREGMKRLKRDTDAHDFFDWGFGASHFWLKQRNGYKVPELFGNRILIVKF